MVISDHGPLIMKLCIPNTQSTYRPWWFNPLPLSEDEFTKFISSEIKMFLEFNQTPGMSPSTVWESLKAYLRGQIISYCANKKRASTECIKKVADEILELDRRQSHSPSTDVIKKRLPLQTDFDLSTRHAEYLISKSRHGYYEHGEKSG